MNAKGIAAIAGVVIVIVAGLWFWGGTGDGYSKDRRVARVQKQMEQAIDEQLPEADQPEGMRVIRVEDAKIGEEMEDFTPAQRQEVANNMIPQVMKMMQRQFQNVLDMPPDEQRQALDRIIDNQQQQADRVAEMLADRGDGPVESNRVEVDSDTDDGERWLMDNMSPEQRAVMQEYVNLVKARMEERGIDSKDVPIQIAVGIQTGGEGEGPTMR